MVCRYFCGHDCFSGRLRGNRTVLIDCDIRIFRNIFNRHISGNLFRNLDQFLRFSGLQCYLVYRIRDMRERVNHLIFVLKIIHYKSQIRLGFFNFRI